MTKKAAFDIGNVLCHVDLKTFFQYLVDAGFATHVREGEEFFSGIQCPMDLGLFTVAQGFYKFNPRLTKPQLKDLGKVWADVVIPSEPMMGVLDKALSQGYEVALLSNIGHDHGAVVRDKCKIFSKCNQHFSYEVGARKPTKLFYQSFAMQYGWPNDVMFFDDRQDNVDSASLYFKGIKFDIETYKDDTIAARYIRSMLDI